MTTATKQKRASKDATPQPDVTAKAVDVIRQAAQQQRLLQAGCHAVCVTAARGVELSADPHAIVAALEKTRDEFTSDVGRVQAVAGTTADRKSTQQSFDDATKKRDAEAPTLYEQIKTMETKIAELDNGVKAAQVDVLRREKSAAWLREPSHLPPAQEHSYHNQCKALKDRLLPTIGCQRHSSSSRATTPQPLDDPAR